MLQLALGLFDLALSAVLAVLVVFTTYRVFIKANTDFDEEEEIKKGNVSVGILVAALLLASANIIQQALSPVMNLVALQLGGFSEGGPGGWKVALYAVAHLALAFVLLVAAVSFSLRLFGRLARGRMRLGRELHEGNVAVGLVLAGVVFVVSLYIGEGIHALAKALVPQPSVTQMRIMR